DALSLSSLDGASRSDFELGRRPKLGQLPGARDGPAVSRPDVPRHPPSRPDAGAALRPLSARAVRLSDAGVGVGGTLAAGVHAPALALGDRPDLCHPGLLRPELPDLQRRDLLYPLELYR